MAKARPLDIKDQEYIARLRKSGKTFRQICNITGKSLGAVTNAVDKLKIDPVEIKELQKTQKKDIEDKARKEVAEFVPSDKASAIDVHRKAMKSFDKNPGIALSAAEKTLDRIEGKPIQRNLNANINEGVTNDQIQRMLNDKGFCRVLDNL